MRQKTRALILALAGLMLSACQTSERLPDQCYETPDSGMCRAAFTRYYLDQRSGQCRAFIWGGCGGNVPFETMEDCQSTCKSEAADDPVPEATGNKGLSF